MARAPMLVPAMAPVENRFGARECAGIVPGSGGAGEGAAMVVSVELVDGRSGHGVGDPILTRFRSRVARLCHSVKVPASWLTER